MTLHLRLGLALLSSLPFAACGGGGGGSVSGTPVPTPTVATIQSQFGNDFTQIYGKDPNSDPVDPVPDSAVAAVSLTAEPIALQ